MLDYQRQRLLVYFGADFRIQGRVTGGTGRGPAVCSLKNRIKSAGADFGRLRRLLGKGWCKGDQDCAGIFAAGGGAQ